MRAFVLALIAVVLVVVGFSGLTTAEAEVGRMAALLGVALWLVGETWVARGRTLAHAAALQSQRVAEVAAKEQAARDAQAAKAAEERMRQLTGDVTALRRRAELADALEAENARLRDDLAVAARRVEEAQRLAKGAAAKAGDAEVVSFLALLQQKGRFLDFIMDDVTKYPDAQIGAAARVVHQGCAAVVRDAFDIRPVHDGQEGGSLTLTKDYDPHRYRLLGRVTGEPPFRGRVLHRGWLTTSVKLPERIAPAAEAPGVAVPGIIAPAEVELS